MSNTNVVGPLTLLQAAEVAQWYEAIAPHLKNWLSARGSITAQEADDIIQDVFVRVLEHASAVVAMSAKDRRNYTFAIATNLNTDRLRRWGHDEGKRTSGTLAADIPAHRISHAANTRAEWLAHAQPYAQPEQTTEARMTLRAVWEATPQQYRDILTLFAQGYTASEMAAVLGINQRAVMVRIWRMRRALLEVGGKIA